VGTAPAAPPVWEVHAEKLRANVWGMNDGYNVAYGNLRPSLLLLFCQRKLHAVLIENELLSRARHERFVTQPLVSFSHFPFLSKKN